MEGELKTLYVLAEMTYINQNKGVPEEKLFPPDWYSSTDYQLKTEIIAEAIKNKELVIDTAKYNEAIKKPTNISNSLK